MSQPQQDPPIVISGGSVTLEFNADQLPSEGKGKHGNKNKTLKRITIKGDGIDYAKDFPTGRGVIIEILYGNGNVP
jgi:hypothetical protein